MSGLPYRLGARRPPGGGGAAGVSGPESSTIGNFATFGDAAGKLLADSGYSPASFAAAVHTHTASQISDASANGRSLITAADYAAMRTLLSLVKGVAAGNIPVLDGSGKLDTSIIPAYAISEPFVVASQSAMLALTAQTGDVAIRTDLNKSFILATNSPGTLGDWKELLTPTDAVLSVAGLTGAISAAALKTALAIALADITDMSANARTFNAAANYAAMRTALGVAIGSNVQAYDADLAAIAALTPTNGNVITGNGTTWTSAAPAGATLPTLIVRDEKTVNTDGGASSASWISRDLNTVVVNTVSGASLASNQVTLPAGTYEVTGWDTASQSDGHRCRLYIVADGTTLLTGSTDRGVSGVNMTGYSQLNGRFTIASSKAINLQTYCQTAKATDGLGKAANAASTPEVYSSLKFVKVS